MYFTDSTAFDVLSQLLRQARNWRDYYKLIDDVAKGVDSTICYLFILNISSTEF